MALMTVIARCLLAVMGYDRAVVSYLSRKDFWRLALSSLLCLCSAFLYAVSAAYLAYVAVYADFARWLTATGIGIGVFLFAVTMQRLFVSTGGYAHHWDQQRLAQWRPDRLRLVCVVIIALLLSLPYLLMSHRDRLDQQIEEIRQTKAAFYRDQLRRARDDRREDLSRARALVAEDEQRVTARIAGAVAPVKHTAVAQSGRRRALLIGVHRYQHFDALPGVGTDVQTLERSLADAGFITTVSIDETRDQLVLKIDSYLKSLQKGDISIVYYEGHALQRAGRNHLVPADYQPGARAGAYPISQLIDDVANTSPQWSIVVLDVKHRFPESAHLGLAPVHSQPNTVVVTAIPPGTVQPANVASDSMLAATFAHQIGVADNPQQMLQRVVTETAERSLRLTGWKQQVVATFGKHTDLFRSADIAAASEKEGPPGTVGTDSVGCREDSVQTLQRCLRARLNVLDASLNAIQRHRHAEDEHNVDLYLASLHQSSMLSERWKLLWDERGGNIVLALLIALAMVLGDLLRDLGVDALRSYEQWRAAGARIAIEAGYEKARQSVGDALTPYAAGPLPGLRWHELNQYFENPSAARLSLGGVVAAANGSDAELRQALILPATTPLLPAPQKDANPDSTGPVT
ncbi:caspase family protein [Noviherbaspirillum pedocola]|uniref:Caspase family protein n=1 Tax=Noviherbaspirillum pedocola TaxID=2801341 RepID=A0A934W1J6_9BURK|nr:DUF4407 domain-containing protein [Noviherbaspirillum pedocola]MBK4735251.1 caspase family protein [Noviherbaspirillum pedocola]